MDIIKGYDILDDHDYVAYSDYTDLKQQRDDLLIACKIGLKKALGISNVAIELGAEITPQHKKNIEIIEAAIAKAKA